MKFSIISDAVVAAILAELKKRQHRPPPARAKALADVPTKGEVIQQF